MRRLILTTALFVLAATPTFARADQDRVSFGSDITVAKGETSNDIVCAFCSVRIHGNVKGDVAVFLGTVSIDENQTISGDVALLGGDLNLHEEAEVGGDVVIIAGHTNLASGAAIRGSRMVLPGVLWLLLPLAPLFILIGIIWLIVYLVRRNRYPHPVYPNGRRV
jgi:hypothetical protein